MNATTALGWALLHFFWQGLLIAMLAGFMFPVWELKKRMRRNPPRIRLSAISSITRMYVSPETETVPEKSRWWGEHPSQSVGRNTASPSSFSPARRTISEPIIESVSSGR